MNEGGPVQLLNIQIKQLYEENEMLHKKIAELELELKSSDDVSTMAASRAKEAAAAEAEALANLEREKREAQAKGDKKEVKEVRATEHIYVSFCLQQLLIKCCRECSL